MDCEFLVTDFKERDCDRDDYRSKDDSRGPKRCHSSEYREEHDKRMQPKLCSYENRTEKVINRMNDQNAPTGQDNSLQPETLKRQEDCGRKPNHKCSHYG